LDAYGVDAVLAGAVNLFDSDNPVNWYFLISLDDAFLPGLGIFDRLTRAGWCYSGELIHDL